MTLGGVPQDLVIQVHHQPVFISGLLWLLLLQWLEKSKQDNCNEAMATGLSFW